MECFLILRKNNFMIPDKWNLMEIKGQEWEEWILIPMTFSKCFSEEEWEAWEEWEEWEAWAEWAEWEEWEEEEDNHTLFGLDDILFYIEWCNFYYSKTIIHWTFEQIAAFHRRLRLNILRATVKESLCLRYPIWIPALSCSFKWDSSFKISI